MVSASYLVFYGVVAGIGVTLNIVVLISFNSSTILVDSVFLVIHLLFWIPKAIYPVLSHMGELEISVLHIADTIGTLAWFHNALGHVFIAWNKFFVIIFFDSNFFTRRKVIIMAIVHHLIASTVTALMQFVIPCCRLSFNIAIFTYVNVEKGDLPNYSATYFTLPINALSTATSLFCYLVIFIFVRRARSEFLYGDEIARQRKSEYRYGIQFALLAFVFTFCWISFRVFPLFIPLSDPSLAWLFGLTTATTMVNAFMNALVYLLNNSEVQNNLPFRDRASTVQAHQTVVQFVITKPS